MPTVAPLDLDGHCVAAAFLGGVPHFALADGTIHRLDHGHKTLAVHDGLLSATLDQTKSRLITGGEDGKVCSSAGETTEILAEAGEMDHKRRLRTPGRDRLCDGPVAP